MSIRKQIVQYANRKVARKLMRAMPWLGGVVALATLGAAIRRKGALRGTADTALDFIPFVGGVKNAAEIVRGRDLLPDRPTRTQP
jgi:Pre-toxin TG